MRSRGRARALTALALVVSAVAGWAQGQPSALNVPTVWRNDALWVSVREAAKALDFEFQYQPPDQKVEATRQDHQAVASIAGGDAWVSADNRLFVPAAWLEKLGYTVRWGAKANHAVVTWDDQAGLLIRRPKSIAVDLTRQQLFAREGDVLVYQFRTSTGKLGFTTPSGDYKVLRKEPMHISTIYPKPHGGAKMPYSLWFHGGYFIHGYKSVPQHPASHGCIRLTIPDAKTLFDWTPVGTPVRIYRSAEE